MSTPVVHATWFHADTPTLRGEYSQTLGDSTSNSHYAIYFSCVQLFFASHVRQSRKEILKFFVNEYGYSVLPHNLKNQLTKWEVEIIILSNKHSGLVSSQKVWLNQYFVLDIFAYQANLLEDFHLFDSDVIVMNSKEIKWAKDSQLKLFKSSSNPSECINGLFVFDILNLWNIFNNKNETEYIPYYGGEYVGIRSTHIKLFAMIIEKYFRKNLELSKHSSYFAREEAHLISITSKDFLVDSQTDTLIDRIWTQPWTYRNIPKNFADLTFLHVPAEKKTGLARISKISENPESWFWNSSDAEWRQKVGKLLGIPNYSFIKYAQDFILIRKGFLRHAKGRILDYKKEA